MVAETFAQLAERLSRTSKPSEADHRKFWSHFYHVSSMEDAATVEQDVVKVITRHTLPELLVNKKVNVPIFTDVWSRALQDASGLSQQAQEALVAAWADLVVVETVGMTQEGRKRWFLTMPRYQTFAVVRTVLPRFSNQTVGSLWRVMNHLFSTVTAEKILADKASQADASAVIVASYFVNAKGAVSSNIVQRLPELLAEAYPDLADLPQSMLLGVVASQPFPEDWYVDVSLMPDGLVWAAPGQKAEDRT